MTKQEVLDKIPINISTGFAIKTGDTPIRFTKLPANTWSMNWVIQGGMSVSPMSGDINTPFTATYNDRSGIGRLKLKSGNVEIAMCIRRDSYGGVTYSGPMNSSSESKVDTAGLSYISVPSSGGWFIVTYNSPDITVNEVDSSDFSLYKYGHASVVGYISGNTGYQEKQKGFSVKVSNADSVYFTVKVPARSLSVQPKPLIFEPEGGIKTLTVTTTDINYTVNWRSKSGFFHEGDNYPSNPGEPLKDRNIVSIHMPETKYAEDGGGVLEFRYSDGKLATTVEVKQKPAELNYIRCIKTFNADDSGSWSYTADSMNGSSCGVELTGIAPDWITIDSVTKKPVADTHVAQAVIKGTIKPNKSVLSRTASGGDNYYSIFNNSESILVSLRRVGAKAILNQLGASQYFTLNPKSVLFGANGGTKSEVSIDTNYTSFTNSEIPSWITQFKYTANSSGVITISAEPNPSEQSRSATIQFRNGNIVLDTLTITQAGQDLYFEVDPKSIRAPKEGGDYTVMVKTNMQYKMEVEESTTDFGTTWFTIAQANAVKEIPYLVTVKPNLSSRNFSGRIVFTPTGKSPVIVNITQDGAAPYIVYEPRSTEIDKDTHTWEVIRRHNLPSIIERENLVGLTYTKEEISPYPNAITKYTITASENTSSADRSSYLETSSELYSGGNVNIEGGNTDTIMARYNVIQRSNIVFDVVDSNYSPIRYMTVPAKGNNYRVYVKHNVYWSDTIDNPSWITGPNNTIAPEPGTHYYELGFGVATNEGDARDGTITFNSPRGGTIVLHIHQEAGLVPLIKVSPESITVDSNEHKVMLNVYASHPWSLVHVQAARFILPDWLDLDIVKGGAGVTTITVSIKQALLVDRAELLTFKLDDYEAYDDATIIQRGIENGYDITDVQDDSDWSKRKEAKIRDKYLKVKIRYTGNELAIITALKTLYETSFA